MAAEFKVQCRKVAAHTTQAKFQVFSVQFSVLDHSGLDGVSPHLKRGERTQQKGKGSRVEGKERERTQRHQRHQRTQRQQRITIAGCRGSGWAMNVKNVQAAGARSSKVGFPNLPQMVWLARSRSLGPRRPLASPRSLSPPPRRLKSLCGEMRWGAKRGVGSGAGDMCPGAEAQWRLRSPSAVTALWRDRKSERSVAICLEAKGGTKVTIIYDNSTRSRSLGPCGPAASPAFLSPPPRRLKSPNLTNLHSREKGRGSGRLRDASARQGVGG